MKTIARVMLGLAFLGLAGWITYFFFFEEIAAMSTNIQQVNTSKTANAAPVKNIQIETTSVDVHIIPNDNQEQVIVNLNGRASKKFKDRYKLELAQSGNTIRVQVKEKKAFSIGFYMSDVRIDVQVPRRAYDSLKIKTSSGDITGDGLEAKQQLLTADSGDIRLKNIKGEKLEATASSGDVALTSASSKEMHIQTKSGDIIADFIQSENSDIISSSGDVKLRELKGKVMGHTQSGDFSLKTKKLLHDLTIKSGSGDVSLLVMTEPAAMTLDVTSSSGSNHVEGTQLQYEEKSEHHLRASIGSGGPAVKVETQSGDFTLEMN